MTPAQLKQLQLEKQENGFYATEEVDRLLSQLTQDYSDVFAENGNLIRKLSTLTSEVDFYKEELSKERGARYDLIALDPPTFGRGSSGQLWKIEDDLPKLLELCRELRDPARPFELVLSCHSPGFSVLVLERIVAQIFGRGEFESGEMFIPESTGRKLPAGVSVVYRSR